MAPRTQTRGASGLSTLLGIAGLSHFVVPGFYDAIVPHALPGPPRRWTLASGLAELVCAAMVASPRTRRAGAGMAAVVFVAVFPANVQMAVDWRHKPVSPRALAYLRLPLQLPLVWWAWRVRRHTVISAADGNGQP